MPLMVALILTIIMQQLIGAVVPADAYLYRLFRPAGGWIMGVVPGLIAFALFWTLTDLALKFRVSRGNERDLNRPEINQLPGLVAQEASNITLQRLRGWEPGVLARPVGRRILWILRQSHAADAQRTHELLRHQSDVDADSAASGYRTVKLFIWAMPILGFIGTVLGISLAVGGFSDFLTTSVSIDEIDRVTAELGEVASGLSFAFDTTLLGLLAGLISSVASSGVERREERLLTRLDELGLRIVANAAPAAAAATTPATSPPAGAPGEEFEQMMRARLDDLSGLMGQFTQAVRSGLDGFLGEWAKLPPEVERVSADLTGLRQHLATAARGTEELIAQTKGLVDGLNETASRMSSGLETSIGSVRHTVEGLGDNLHGVSDMLTRNMAGMEQANHRLEAALASSSDQVAAASDRLLAGVESQGAAEQAMKDLSVAVSELGERLSDIREAQVALAPVLSQLAGPLELRLTPTQRVSRPPTRSE